MTPCVAHPEPTTTARRSRRSSNYRASWPARASIATSLLAAPDFEELGLIGSQALVPWLQDRYLLRGAIVFDAIAYMVRTPHSQVVPRSHARRTQRESQ
jgi:hypothetical protein